MKLLLCSILCLCVIFMSCCHLIAWVSKVSFIISGSSWSYNFVSPLCCQQTSSCIHCIPYVAVSCCSWCYSLWCYYCHILTSFSTNNLISSWVSKLIDIWSTTSLVYYEWCLRLWSLENHCTFTAERHMNTYNTWRHGNTHGKQSVSCKPKRTWELTSNIPVWLIMKVAQFPSGGRETDCQDYARHSPRCQEAD